MLYYTGIYYYLYLLNTGIRKDADLYAGTSGRRNFMPQTTLILKNACIYTMDGRVEEAVAISGDKIAKVGSNQEMEAWQGDHTQVIESGGTHRRYRL